MNRRHLRAFLWLRWRLFVNQLQRGGIANTVIMTLLTLSMLLMAVFFLITLFCVGLFALGDAPDRVILYIWDGVVVVFLLIWATGVMSDLQRTDALSLDKFLHLPVSLSGVFVLNYLSSLLSVSLILFVPAMVGFALGLACARGLAMLLVLPLVASFILMVTALTYQFQGWLASLMTNQRRRRTIIVMMTALFLLLTQSPNLVNLYNPWKRFDHDDLQAELIEAQKALQQEMAEQKITPDEFQKQNDEALRRYLVKKQEETRQAWQELDAALHLGNIALPPGWLPRGALAVAEGDLGIALACFLGMSLIGTASLWRAYHTTTRLYTGYFTAGSQTLAHASTADATAASPRPAAAPPAYLLEIRLPGLSEAAAAVALASFRSLSRAPEAKILLLTPVFLLVIFGGILFRSGKDLPQAVSPLLAYAAMAMILFSFAQLLGNQFGFDRSGFRVYILSPAPRRDILLGKNLAVLPLALTLSLLAVIFVEIFFPLRVDHLVALLPQWICMYLLFCLIANGLSIFAPMPVASGTLKPISPKLSQVLIHMIFVFFFPAALAPTLLPYGIEQGLEALAWIEGIPLSLLLMLLECAAVVVLYRRVLTWQGTWLHLREQTILNTVVTKSE